MRSMHAYSVLCAYTNNATLCFEPCAVGRENSLLTEAWKSDDYWW